MYQYFESKKTSMKAYIYLFMILVASSFSTSLKAANYNDSIDTRYGQMKRFLGEKEVYFSRVINRKKNIDERTALVKNAVIHFYNYCSASYDDLFEMRNRIVEIDTFSINRFEKTMRGVCNQFDYHVMSLKNKLQHQYNATEVDSLIVELQDQLNEEIWEREHHWMVDKVLYYREGVMPPSCDGALKAVLFEQITRRQN
jgi:hypothetical protein